MSNQYQQRPFNDRELIAQIGTMNVLAISGGRVHSVVNDRGEVVEVQLPVGKGYRVAITLGADDTYIVRREYVRKGIAKVKGVQGNVYFDEVGEIAYVASCFVNREFGEKVGA